MCVEAARLLNEYNHAVVEASKAAQKLAELARSLLKKRPTTPPGLLERV
jgi:hypothetical protein